jgi:predicted permease
METVIQELRFAARALLKRKGYAAVAIVTIALGIGANTAIFSVIDGVLLRPLPFFEPDRLVLVGSIEDDAFGVIQNLAHPEAEAMEELAAFSAVSAFRGGRLTLTGLGPAETVMGAHVTRGLFDAFGVTPFIGRDLLPEEAVDPDRAVIVLSHRFWAARLGATAEVLGSTVTLDNQAFEVVGVAPAGWAYPEGAEFWVPGGTVEGDCWWGCSLFNVVARLAPGVSLDRAQAELDALATRLVDESPTSQTGRGFRAASMHGEMVGDVRGPLWVILGAVGLVLLIACANVAHLLLARGASRSGEFAVRGALGASKARLAGSVIAEGALLATVGGVLGVGFGWAAIRALPLLSDGSIPRIDGITLNPMVLGFSAALVLFSTLAFSLIPGLRAARGQGLGAEVRRSGRGVGAGGRGRSLLLAAEVALSVVLLVGAGLLLRTFGAMTAVDLGFETEQITRFNVSLPDRGYEEAEQVIQFVDAIETGLGALPGIRGVSVAVGAPLTNFSIGGSPRFLSRPEPAAGEGPSAAVRIATPGHWDVYGLVPVRGRLFDKSDRRGEPTAYVVNETFVERYFSDGQDPIGEELRMGLGFGYGREPGRIVGVVRDVSTNGYGWRIEPELYIPHEQLIAAFFTVSVATGEAGLSRADIVRVLAEVDPDIPIYRLDRIEEAIGGEMAPTRFYLTLIGTFALLAMMLAAVGLYGVIAYTVAQRTREIGLRVALGADHQGIVRLILGQGLAPTGLGIVVGLLVSTGAVRVLRSILFGVEPLDPVTFVVMPLVLLAVATLAILVPARRAARVHPTEALRG